MPATAENLRDLHDLHRRAKALRDRLTSNPKTLAARQAALAARRTSRDEAHKALQDTRAKVRNREVQLQGQQTRTDDLKVKLNQVKKNDEYKAIQNQIAHDQATIAQTEDEILEAYTRIDTQAAELATLDAEVQRLTSDVESFRTQIESQAGQFQTQLEDLEAAIVEAEGIIPLEQRDQYRRNVKQRGADAFAAVSLDDRACSGCFVSVTPQMVNELITCSSLIFCKTCGRILYQAEE